MVHLDILDERVAVAYVYTPPSDTLLTSYHILCSCVLPLIPVYEQPACCLSWVADDLSEPEPEGKERAEQRRATSKSMSVSKEKSQIAALSES